MLVEAMNFGIEGIGHEKFRGQKEYRESLAVIDEFTKMLSAKGLTKESFKALPVDERAKLRLEMGLEIQKKVEAGQLDDPNEKDPKKKEDKRNEMKMFAVIASMSQGDAKEIMEREVKKAPPEQKQQLFNVYAASIIARTETVI